MSGGVWTQADAHNTSTRPGVFLNFIGTAQAAVQVGAAGIVGITGDANWGKMNGYTSITAESTVTDMIGTVGNLPLLATQALRGGASEVLVYRVAGSGAAKATVTLNDIAGTPLAALTVTALYEGTRGNNFSIKVAINASDASKRDLTVLENGIIKEVFTATDNDEVAAQITGTVSGVNASRYVTAVISGTANRSLGVNGAGTALTGGLNGATLTNTEYLAGLAGLELRFWHVLVCGDTTSSTTQAAVHDYVDRLRASGQRVMGVIGGINLAGAIAADVATEFAAARTAATATTTGNHEGIIYVFPGIVDEVTGVGLSGAQSAARAAGLIAQAGSRSSVTKAVTGAGDVTARMTNADIRLGLASGLMIFTVEGFNDIVIEQGINTLTTFTVDKPRSFRKIRTIRTMDDIATTISNAASQSLIGKVGNDANGKAFTIGLITQSLQVFEEAGTIEPGSKVSQDVTNNATADPDEFFVNMEFTPIDSLEKVFISARVL